MGDLQDAPAAGQHPDLELTPEELLAEHGIAGYDRIIRHPSPADRIGHSLSLLGDVRKVLDTENAPIDERLDRARLILTRLWVELVAVEVALSPVEPR